MTLRGLAKKGSVALLNKVRKVVSRNRAAQDVSDNLDADQELSDSTVSKKPAKKSQMDSSSSEEEPVQKPAKKPFNKTAKKPAKKSQMDSSSSEEEPVKKPAKKPVNKTAKRTEDMQMISFKYNISDEDHPFNALNNKVGSIELSSIITKNFDPENVSFLI